MRGIRATASLVSAGSASPVAGAWRWPRKMPPFRQLPWGVTTFGSVSLQNCGVMLCSVDSPEASPVARDHLCLGP